MFDVMSGRQWSMSATVTLREAKHGSLLKRHRGLSISHDADRMVSKWVIVITYNQLLNGVYWGYDPLTNHLLTSWDIQVVRACHFASGHRQRHRLRPCLRSG